jgi:lysophospholipase L1-like esterase
MDSRMRALRIVWCAILAIGTLEFLARLDDGVHQGAPFFGRYDMSILTGYDRLGRILLPNSRYYRWKINSSGYRGPEPRSSTVRILCLGASETFGIGEDAGREYPRQLEEQLNKRWGTHSVEVINLGFPGGVLHEMVARLPEIVSRYHPALVTIYQSPASYIWFSNPALARKIALSRPSAFNLRILDKADQLADAALPPRLLASWRHCWANLDALAYGSAPMDRLPEEPFTVLRSDLERTIDFLNRRSIKVVLITHAQRFGATSGPGDWTWLTAWRTSYPPLKENGFLDMERRANEVIREVGSDQGVLLVDAARLIAPGPNNFADFVHFSNEGAERMATILAEKLALARTDFLGDPAPTSIN